MNYRQAFHEAHCAQQGLSLEEDCNVPHDQLRLLHESVRVWIVLYEEEGVGAWINVVSLSTTHGQREMETIEL